MRALCCEGLHDLRITIMATCGSALRLAGSLGHEVMGEVVGIHGNARHVCKGERDVMPPPEVPATSPGTRCPGGTRPPISSCLPAQRNPRGQACSKRMRTAAPCSSRNMQRPARRNRRVAPLPAPAGETS